MIENTDHHVGEYLLHMTSGSGAKICFLRAKENSEFLRNFNAYYIVETIIYPEIDELLKTLRHPQSLRSSSVACHLLSDDRYLFFTTDERCKAREVNLATTKNPKKPEVGSTITGRVKNIISYGIFVNLGDSDGLLHISELSLSPINHPSEAIQDLEQGSEIEVSILSNKQGRISLGASPPLDAEWSRRSAEFDLGQTVSAQVKMIKKNSALLQLPHGLTGVIDREEASWRKHPKNISNILSPGDWIEAVIIKIDNQMRQIHLSIKQLIVDTYEEELIEFKKGQIVTGVISQIAQFGLFVEIKPKIIGLLHFSNVSWTLPKTKVSQHFSVGSQIDVKIIDINLEQHRVDLGIKQLTSDPWEKLIPERYPLHSVHSARIVQVGSDTILLKIDAEVDAIIDVSLLEMGHEFIRLNTELFVKVSRLNLERRKIVFVPSESSQHNVEQGHILNRVNHLFKRLLNR